MNQMGAYADQSRAPFDAMGPHWIATRITEDVQDDPYVNPGFGMPTHVADNVRKKDTLPQLRDDVLGMTTFLIEGGEDSEPTHVGRQTITELPRTVRIYGATSCGLIRRGNKEGDTRTSKRSTPPPSRAGLADRILTNLSARNIVEGDLKFVDTAPTRQFSGRARRRKPRPFSHNLPEGSERMTVQMTGARTHYGCQDRAISDATLRAIYDDAKMGPTSMNQ